MTAGLGAFSSAGIRERTLVVCIRNNGVPLLFESSGGRP